MYTRNHPSTGFTHRGDVLQRPRWLQRWETLRHGSLHWLIECMGEALGVYFYVYLGTTANTAANVGNLTKQAGLGSLQTIALGYGLGIVFAISIAGPVAGGGHFNPCITVAAAVWRGFPWRKVPRFIFFQILGGYIAALVVYAQYRTTLKLLEEGLVAANQYDALNFTPGGVAGSFAVYAPPNASLRDLFVSEFFGDILLAIIVWGVLDPTNFHVSPSIAPWIIGLAYTTVIWGPTVISANSARDLGTRFMVLTIWGGRASGGSYAALAALTNFPATLIATLFYEVILVDSSRVLPRAQQEFLDGHKAYLDHRSQGVSHQATNSSHSSSDKGDFKAVEHVV